jgi:Fic family protein
MFSSFNLGFVWDSSYIPKLCPARSIEAACLRFSDRLPVFVWDAGVLEDNPVTLLEVQTLLAGGEVTHRKLTDQEQILNLIESSKRLLALVKSGEFTLSKAIFTQLNGLVARNEALEWGVFRGEGLETNYTPNVGLGEAGYHTPIATTPGAPTLNQVFHDGVSSLEACAPFERALAFFLFGALQQFFFDGNKRTSRFMMNGVLMSNGIDAISVPAAKAQAFNEKMVRFYQDKNGTEMMAFLVSCHPDAASF